LRFITTLYKKEAVIKKAGRFLPVLFLLAGSLNHINAQEQDYTKIFGADWDKALSYIRENDSWIRPALEKYNVPYAEAVAVVFPELVRYSALRDKMEISVLKALYCSLGDDYADFSIGVFQVKPSFAEKVRSETGSFSHRKLFDKKKPDPGTYAFRKSIVDDLENPQRELNYIIAFLKICGKRFPENLENDSARIKFLATAYNTGFWKTEEEINAMANKKFFNTKLFKTENYSYADVSLFWYNQYLNNEKKDLNQ
jgi:hypothetical protein